MAKSVWVSTIESRVDRVVPSFSVIDRSDSLFVLAPKTGWEPGAGIDVRDGEIIEKLDDDSSLGVILARRIEIIGDFPVLIDN